MKEVPASRLAHYYLFFLGQQVSSFGSSLVSFAIIYYITIVTESGWYLAVASIATFTPMMLMQFVSGYFTDYFNRKHLLVLVDLGQAIGTSVLVVVFMFNSENMVWIFSILIIRSIFDGLHAPAKGAIIPTMVPEDKLQRINALESTGRSIINLVSPILGAFLVVIFRDDFWIILSFDAITFLIAILPFFWISVPDIREEHQSGESLKSKLLGGYKYLNQTTGLIPLLILFAMFNFFITPTSMLVPLIILTEKGFNSSGVVYASVMMISSLGFLLMSTVLSRVKLPIKPHLGVILGFSVTITALSILSYSIFTRQLYLFYIGEFLLGSSLPMVNVFSSYIWQTKIPVHYQGRVISVRMIITTLAIPLSMLLYGIITTKFSLTSIFSGSTLAFLLILLLIWIFTDFSKVGNEDISDQVVAETVSVKEKVSIHLAKEKDPQEKIPTTI